LKKWLIQRIVGLSPGKLLKTVIFDKDRRINNLTFFVKDNEFLNRQIKNSKKSN